MGQDQLLSAKVEGPALHPQELLIGEVPSPFRCNVEFDKTCECTIQHLLLLSAKARVSWSEVGDEANEKQLTCHPDTQFRIFRCLAFAGRGSCSQRIIRVNPIEQGQELYH
jgi:hypothetical protein